MAEKLRICLLGETFCGGLSLKRLVKRFAYARENVLLFFGRKLRMYILAQTERMFHMMGYDDTLLTVLPRLLALCKGS